MPAPRHRAPRAPRPRRQRPAPALAVLLTAVLVVVLGTVVAASATASTTPTQQLLAQALAARESRPVVMVGAGSSTTAGSYATAVEKRWLNVAARGLQAAYPLASGATQPGTRSLSAALQERPSASGIQFVNAGVGGTTAADYLTSTTASQVASLQPDVVFHMVGSNDFARNVPVATYRANLEARIDQIDAGADRPVLHVLLHAYERFDASVTDGTRHRWSEYGAVLAAVAAARPANVMSMDLSGAYYAVGVPGSDSQRLMDADRIHQVDAGHAFMADLVLRSLTPTPTPTATSGTVLRDVFVSSSPDRSGSTRLQDATLAATTPVYVHAAVSDGWRSVKFYLDDPAMAGLPVRSDTSAPFDLKGNTATGAAVALEPGTLGAGSHTISAQIKLASGVNTTKTATFTVGASTSPTPTGTATTTPTATPTATPGTIVRDVFVSYSPDRSSATRLDGATLTATTPTYVHAAVSDSWRSVKFWIDDPAMTGLPVRSDTSAPFDLKGSTATGSAVALEPGTLGAGSHTITAQIKLASGVNATRTATFTVD